GTGDKGKLYRVSSAGAKPESSILVDTNQTHIMSLAVTAQGDLIAGTDPGGLVLRVSPDGKAFALLDASLREMHAVAPPSDGSVYCRGLAGVAATTRATTTTAAARTDAAAAAAAITPAVTAADETAAAAAQPSPTRSRSDLTNARTAVFRILPDGG